MIENRAPIHFARTIQKHLQLFKYRTDGAISIIFAISAALLFGISAMAIDYARAIALKERLQQKVDAAILAGARVHRSADRAMKARTFFEATSSDLDATLTNVSFSYDPPARTVSGTVSAALSTPLVGLTGNIINVTARGSATTKDIVRALDFVMCIDSTKSMWKTLAAVQNNALNFKYSLDSELDQIGAPKFDQYRIRVIYFKDYGGFGYQNDDQNRRGLPQISGTDLGDPEPIKASDFFTLPNDSDAFVRFVTGVTDDGGGDDAESGLECLNEAMDSNWTRKGALLADGRAVTEIYPIIAIYTDDGAHPPNFRWSVANPIYPPASKMPRTYAELREKWNNSLIDQQNKMILFYGNPWIGGLDRSANAMSGWGDVKDWPGFQNPANLTSASIGFISNIAAALVMPELSRLSK